MDRYSLQVTEGTDIDAVQREIQHNVAALLAGGKAEPTGAPSIVPTTVRREGRQLQSINCLGVPVTILIIVPSQGLSPIQIDSVLQSTPSSSIFGIYASSICSYLATGVVIVSETRAPNRGSTDAPKCLNACLQGRVSCIYDILSLFLLYAVLPSILETSCGRYIYT